MTDVIEIARFYLNTGTSPATVSEQARSLDSWLREREGFLYRTLVGPDAEGGYTDIVRWRSLGDAKRAAQDMPAAPEVAGFMGVIDPQSVQMQHRRVCAELEAGPGA